MQVAIDLRFDHLRFISIASFDQRVPKKFLGQSKDGQILCGGRLLLGFGGSTSSVTGVLCPPV